MGIMNRGRGYTTEKEWQEMKKAKEEAKMKTLKVGVCLLDEDENIISKRTIGTNWEVNVERDLKSHHKVHILDEISTILSENLKLQLTPDVIKEMLNEVKERE